MAPGGRGVPSRDPGDPPSEAPSGHALVRSTQVVVVRPKPAELADELQKPRRGVADFLSCAPVDLHHLLVEFTFKRIAGSGRRISHGLSLTLHGRRQTAFSR